MRKIVLSVAIAGLVQGLTQAQAYQAAPVSNGGTIVGEVSFTGTPPQPEKLTINKDAKVCAKEEKFSEALIVGSNGGLQNAVVYISDISKGKPFEGSSPTLDQNGCRYEPHILLIPSETDFDVLNSDGILHNVHTYSSKNKPLNLAQPKFKKKITKQFAEPETIKVSCDAHPWMNAWLIVHDHPYYVVTDQNGNFSLAGVPPGNYELKVWHETLGEKAQKVSVKANAESSAKFELAL